MSNKQIVNYMDPSYPRQPPFRPNCGVNEIYKTLPQPWPWESKVAGPSTMKHIYTGIPNFYPPMRIYRPVETMYGADFSQIGPYGERFSYTSKMYPLTHRHAREVREYADYMLPFVDIEDRTLYPRTRDASLNLHFRSLPSETQAESSLINTYDNVPKVPALRTIPKHL
jgi:hypothetical protein